MPRRLFTLTFWRTPDGRLLAAVIVCGLLLVAAVAVRVIDQRNFNVDQRNFDQAMCAKVDKLAAAQLGGLRRGLKTLPTLAYYKEHPEELDATKTAIRRQIRAIQAASC